MTILRHILLATIIGTVVVWVVTWWWAVVYVHPRWGFVTADTLICVMIAQSGCDLTVYLHPPGLHVSDAEFVRAIDGVWCVSNTLRIPLWLILAVLLPVWWLMGHGSRQRKRWAKEGRCLSCGYNLQGSESGTCSECGEVSAMRQ